MDIIINCGACEISNEALERAIGTFHNSKIYKLGQQIISETVNREIANFHLLRWRATKVVKVVVCARSPILLSLME